MWFLKEEYDLNEEEYVLGLVGMSEGGGGGKCCVCVMGSG